MSRRLKKGSGCVQLTREEKHQEREVPLGGAQRPGPWGGQESGTAGSSFRDLKREVWGESGAALKRLWGLQHLSKRGC